jgi:hypothetical protein
MGSQRRRLTGRFVLVTGLLLTSLLLGACGEDEDSTMRQTTDRPSMETIIDDYTQMRTEMLAAVDEIAGPGEWVNSSSFKGITGSACRAGEDPDGQRANLPNYTRQGPLTGDDRESIQQAVWKVGRAHGFDEVGTIVDRPDDWEIFGEDPYGGRYVFGSAVNTVVSIGTGCHRYDVPPSPAPAPSGIPDYAKKDKG